MSTKKPLQLALLAVLAGSLVIAGVITTQGDASREHASLSNRGGAAVAIRGLRLPSARITSGHVLGVRDGRALYRLDRASEPPCFAAGSANELGTPGSVVCPQGGFPRAGEPVLDFSAYESTRHDVREFSLYRVAGIAADGVAAVEFFRPDGTVVLTVPVSENVYATTNVPKGPIAGFAALDKDGKRIWRSP
jgi:hypothetical protein